MITETTRTCRSCGALLGNADEAPACPKCGAVAAPHVDAWPPKLKRWLILTYLRQAFAPYARNTPHQRWEFLLRAVMSGRSWGTGRDWKLLPRAATPAECYVAAVRELERWIEEGEPADLDTIEAPASARAGA